MKIVNKLKKLDVYSGPSYLIFTDFVASDGSIREHREQCLTYTKEQAEFMVGVLDVYSDTAIFVASAIMEALKHECES